MAALGFEIMLGSITVGGTIIAAGKLQEWITSKPVTYKGQNLVNALFFLGIASLFVYTIVDPSQRWAFYTMMVASFVFGIMLVMPIGGADMPVVVALLEFVFRPGVVRDGLRDRQRHSDHQRIARRRVGIHSVDPDEQGDEPVVHERAVRRVRKRDEGDRAARVAEGLTVRSIGVEDAAIQLAYAQLVIVIPGYGMAVAQAQHAVRELTEIIEKRGGEVKFAVHPVAGRMPGHMNVLLAEANVPYDKLYDMDEINSEFDRADVALVIGANDVVNPAARNDKTSPIYGMPILNADHAKSVIVLKRGMSAGFAGIENELFYDRRTSMLFGDAKTSLTALIGEMKNV